MARSLSYQTVDGNTTFQNSSTLVFPEDLDGIGYYPDVIKFGIYQKQGASYTELKKSLTNAAAAVKQDFEEVATIQKLKADEDKDFKYVGNLLEGVRKEERKGKDPIIVEQGKKIFNTITEQGKKISSDKQTTTLIKSIYLNMPAALAVDESVTWEGIDMGVAGALKAGGLAGAAESGILNNMGTLLGGAAIAVAGPAGAVLGAIAAGPTLQAGIESSFRVKANPFKEQTFQGIPFRSFSFEFTMRARSQNEIESIQKIVESFRAFSKPSFQESSGIAFKYPHDFRIEFLTKNTSNDSYETNKYLPEIKYCVCTSVNTNFGGDTWRTFKSGAPTEVKLTLQFQETELITQEDVLGVTNVGFFKNYKGLNKGKF